LLRAFWAGAFDGQTSVLGKPGLGSRQWALDVLTSSPSHPNVLFLTAQEDREHPWDEPLIGDDGVVYHDARLRIIVPPNGGWRKTSLHAAYAVLATTSYDDFVEDTVSVLNLIEIDGIAFRQWAKHQGWEVTWWLEKDKSRSTSNTVRREKQQRETQERYERWPQKARELSKKHPAKNVSDIARLVAKDPIGEGCDWTTIRRELRQSDLAR
jgi:hypothetical protein